MSETDAVSVAIERLQGYFVGVPGARLTIEEAGRIGGVNDHLCRQLVTALVGVCFLSREWDGSYRRRTPLFSEEAPTTCGRTRRTGMPYVGR